MDISKGYLRLFRQMLDWEWYDNPNVKVIFLHCLLCANTKAKKWRDITLKRGQFVTSYEKLAAANGLTNQQTRTALKSLQLTNEIEYQSTNQYTVITVKNYNLYQADNTRKNEADVYPNNKRNEGQVTTTNNIDNNNIYNISLSNIEKITEKEREILNNYVKRNKLAKSSVRAYVNALIKNGDHIDILKEEKLRIEKLEAQQKLQAENCPPEKEEKPSPEDTKRGLELLRNTAAEIKRRRTK